MSEKNIQEFAWEKELHSGEIYDPNIKDMMDEQMKHVELLYDFNQTRPSQMEKRKQLMK